MPIVDPPVPAHPEAPVIQPDHAARSAWPNAVETLSSRQAALEERRAAAAKTPDGGSAVEKLSMALKERAVAARASAWAKTVEKVRSRQMALKERAATANTPATVSEFNRT
jgi:hypothetical protein